MKSILAKNFILFLLGSFMSFGLQAQDIKAYEIMKTNDQLEKPNDNHSKIELLLKDKYGNIITRSMESYSIKTDFGYNSFIEVTSPADIAGMRLLSIAKTGEDDQRLYLPSFGKSRKIASSGKTGKFLGSDIYFYDLEDHDLDEFTYRFIGEKEWNGKKYDVIESVPKDKNAPYSKTILWVSVNDYFIYKSEMYDKKGRLLKSLVINKIKTEKNIIIPENMTISNIQDGHSTEYHLISTIINSGVSPNIFTVKNLEK
jgi:hypothetical protein